LWGDLSLVGRSADVACSPTPGEQSPYLLNGAYLGPEGVTGLVQLHASKDLSREERERYELYYAKNQSLLLDVEILLKSMMNAIRG
jgi:lipopolysaccharide/colanic/teichoic acid biosynthesis glycosyltransferase